MVEAGEAQPRCGRLLLDQIINDFGELELVGVE